MSNFFKFNREQKNISLEEITRELCYPTYVIEAIENNKVNFLPKPYNYYCAKNYASYLGVKLPNEVAASFQS